MSWVWFGLFGWWCGLGLGCHVLIDNFYNIFLDENDIFSTFAEFYCVFDSLKDLFLKVRCK